MDSNFCYTTLVKFLYIFQESLILTFQKFYIKILTKA